MKLQEIISFKGLTVAELSLRSDLPYTTVSELVMEKKSFERCSVITAVRIAHALGYSVEELLGMTESSEFKDKFSLDKTYNLFLAKRKWDENVYCGMKMESRAVTFPETKTILEGINVPGVKLDDILAIQNMRDAWKYLLSTPNEPLTLDYLCRLHSFVGRNEALEWGKLRTGNVSVSGSSYLPPIPEEMEVKKALFSILSSISPVTEKALDVFCLVSRRQLFWDGNKRTALLAANKLLVEYGRGMMTIKDSDMSNFNRELLDFYNSGDPLPLKRFLYSKALFEV